MQLTIEHPLYDSFELVLVLIKKFLID